MREFLGLACVSIAVFWGGENRLWYLTLAVFFMAWKAADRPSKS